MMFICNSDNTIMVDVVNRVISVSCDKNGNRWGIYIQEHVRDEEEDVLRLGDYDCKERAMEVITEIKSAIVNDWDFYTLPEE